MIVLLAAFIFAASPQVTADTTHNIRFVVFDDYVRDELARQWDDTNPEQDERAFCIGYQKDFWAQEQAYRVTRIWPAAVQAAGHTWIRFMCTGKNVATVHVHPPITCASDSDCYLGGSYAHQCLPSDADRMFITMRGDPFGIVQCSREALVTYWPLGSTN